MDFDPADILHQTGGLPDRDIDPAHVALAIAALDHPGISMGRYTSALQRHGESVGQRYGKLLEGGAEDDAATRLAALHYVLAETEAYEGDTETYDNLENADLMRVMDRRKGLPVALAILYMHAARMQGWVVHALSFPGHVVCRLDNGAQRVLFDPFERCRVMEAQDLRAMVKRVVGPHAELSAGYYVPAGNREVIIRLQNNIKLRQVEAADYEGALRTVERMRLIDPDEYRLLLDEGVLAYRTGHKNKSIAALEGYIDHAPDARDRQEAAILLRQVHNMPDGD